VERQVKIAVYPQLLEAERRAANIARQRVLDTVVAVEVLGRLIQTIPTPAREQSYCTSHEPNPPLSKWKRNSAHAAQRFSFIGVGCHANILARNIN
jgi:hypothetical protein